MICLQGGNYSNEECVKAYCNGHWGTICDDGFDFNDAIVPCKQLEYSNYTSYNHLPLYVYYNISIQYFYRSGSSSQHIWMSNLSCNCSFFCLSSCQSCPTNSYQGCHYSVDVTIQYSQG